MIGIITINIMVMFSIIATIVGVAIAYYCYHF